MIFATLGTHPQPMDRLVRRLDQLVAEGIISEQVILQTAALRYRPTHLVVHHVLPYETQMRLVRDAAVVLTHAGPASIAAVRRAGKVPVIVPRSHAGGEHVDAHQEAFAARLSERPGYIVVRDVQQLHEAIEAARSLVVSDQPADVSRAVAVLEDVLRCTG